MGLLPRFRLLDRQEQWRCLFERFYSVFGPELGDLEGDGWQRPQPVLGNAMRYFDRICDEAVSPGDLVRSGTAFISALGRYYRRYERLLLRERVADFSHMQASADLLLDEDDIARRESARIPCLLCVEYQGTSNLQERLLLRLSEVHGNLCVVGDEDQSLYRFRGANVRNIQEFPLLLSDCRVVELHVNYRSHPQIISAYDRWMASADWSNLDPRGAPFRRAKNIAPNPDRKRTGYPAVLALDGMDCDDEGRQLVELLRLPRRRRVIDGYGQVALLLHSVRDDTVAPYLDAFARTGISARCVPAGGRRHRRSGGQDGERVTVTTIHQAKGMEWPVVIVGSLDFHNGNVDPVGRLLRPYLRRSNRQPRRSIAAFEHLRQHLSRVNHSCRFIVD